ncbi:MAG: glycosyltransferase [Rhodoblastus sp.]|nr:glycosyltransferase [Rhodoblastus sp.]
MSGASSQGALTLSLVICTFHREELLRKALESVAVQVAPDEFAFEIVVVDNSDEATARDIVVGFGATSPFPVKFVEAHPPNISVARNAGVAAGAGAAIAFLDDDQELTEGWLTAVSCALRDMPHDAFFGAVEPVFESSARAGARARQLFTRALNAPRGADLVAYGPQKTKDVALATNNSVFRRTALPKDGRLFDLAFGDGGGEDYDLICRMQSEGRRFAWLPGARAREFVPASRCEAAYLRRRFFAGGQAYAAAVANASARPRLARWAIRGKAIVQFLLLIARMPIARARGGEAMADLLQALAGVRGKMSFADIRPIYREASASAR